MHSLRPAVLLIGGLCLLLPAAGRGQKLDVDDKRFLNDVGPLILPDEKAVFKKLKDKADRLVFQEIFWARRDPNLATPENEFQQQYVKDHATADRRFGVVGVSGSATHCGRLFILFGEPDEIESTPIRTPLIGPEGSIHTLPPKQHVRGVYQPHWAFSSARVWVYRDRPDRRLHVASVRIAFNEACDGGERLARQSDRIAATKIVHPSIDYEFGEDGHLVKPADQLAGDTPRRDDFRRP